MALSVGAAQRDFVLHMTSERRVILSKMIDHGFNEESLPPIFGGQYKSIEFVEWQSCRKDFERERSDAT
jgi:hypothetical protein